MEDRIDFPCAPEWIRHYARLGLTRDYPDEYYQLAMIRELREQVWELERQLGHRTEHEYPEETSVPKSTPIVQRDKPRGFRGMAK